MQEQQKSMPMQQQTQQPTARTFELAVYDVDINEATDKEVLRPVRTGPQTVTVHSKAELQEILMQFRQCGQVAKVVRELTEHRALPQQAAAMTTQQNVQKGIPFPPVQKQSANPVYYTINGVQLKNENGKIFQKNWVPLTIAEASNFRIVQDSNNRVFNMTGKHIEMKRWQEIEISTAEADADIQKELSENEEEQV